VHPCVRPGFPRFYILREMPGLSDEILNAATCKEAVLTPLVASLE
jgi:hypothetical protein